MILSIIYALFLSFHSFNQFLASDLFSQSATEAQLKQALEDVKTLKGRLNFLKKRYDTMQSQYDAAMTKLKLIEDMNNGGLAATLSLSGDSGVYSSETAGTNSAASGDGLSFAFVFL